MHLIRWAAVITCGLSGFLIFCSVVENDTTMASRFIRVVLGLAGILAALGLYRALRWGKPAVIGFGLLLLVVGALLLTRGEDAGAAAVVMVPALVIAVLGALSDTDGPLPPWRATPPQRVSQPTEGGVSEYTARRPGSDDSSPRPD